MLAGLLHVFKCEMRRKKERSKQGQTNKREITYQYTPALLLVCTVYIRSKARQCSSNKAYTHKHTHCAVRSDGGVSLLASESSRERAPDAGVCERACASRPLPSGWKHCAHGQAVLGQVHASVDGSFALQDSGCQHRQRAV